MDTKPLTSSASAGSPASETVNHPAHYGGDTVYEAIKVIKAWGLGFALGNALKYICRAPHKGTQLEDLRKARWYIDWQIKELENLSGETKAQSKTIKQE